MKTSVCLAVVIALVVIQMVNAQETTPRMICPRCDFVCLSEDGEFKEESSIRCPPCECPPTCRNFNCSKNEKCVQEQVVCVRAPCFPVPKCIRINGTTTNTTTVTPPICRALFEVRCMAGCERVLGPEGCPTCKCQTTCAAVTCPFGFECKMVVVTCFRAPCPESHAICVPIKTTVATTTPCPVYKCADGCFPTTGPNGCPACDCPPTCKDINCTKDEECFLEQIRQCFAPPCFPTPICVPRNVSCTGTPNTRICIDDPPYRWSYNASTHSCQSFRYYGCTPSPNTFTSRTLCEDKCKPSNDCGHCRDDCYEFKKKGQPPKCICPDPCKNVTCTDGEVCRLTDAVCDVKPCNAPPKPSCVKNPCPRPLPCGKKCEYGLQTDDNGCPLCECCEQPTQT